ncbi:hypothetical protein B0H10DRAFT_1947658 [Mycena sp. CBHHK59/15]|nr:hypothetical protein B0H10DRAFT_1947658 [Mycena sp. CBHHK59/15]
MAAPLNQYNFNNHSGVTRTRSIDPPHTNPLALSREATMSFTPLDRNTSMEPSSLIRTSSSIPRDLSMPLPAAHSSFRMHTSLTPQPAQPRDVSEPPPLSSLAQKPVFVRQPPDVQSRRLSTHSSTSTLGSLVESQRSTRSPMRQHSSLLFGSGSQSQPPESNNARQPPAAERALHELDIYKTPLLPTRSRLRTSTASPSDPSFPSNVSKAVDPSDMFRPRRSSQLLLMRDDRRASGLSRKSSYGFLDDMNEKDGKAKTTKVNETKPYAGEGGMKKLLARRMKEVQDGEEEGPESDHPAKEYVSCHVNGDHRRAASSQKSVESLPPPSPPPLPNWQDTTSSQAPYQSGSSLRVGRTKTHRTHIARPARPSKKFSAAEEDIDDFMDDGDDGERQKELEALEEAAKSYRRSRSNLNVKPVEHDVVNAKEPPIAALPFSFGKPSVPIEPAAPLPAPAETPAAMPQPKPFSSVFSFDRGSEQGAFGATETTAPPEKSSNSTNTVPNFFASSKLLSQAPPSSLFPPAASSFGISPCTLGSPSKDSALTPKPAASLSFPPTPAPATSFTPGPTPIKDAENPLWEGDSGKKVGGDSQPSFFSTKTNSDAQPSPSILGRSKALPPIRLYLVQLCVFPTCIDIRCNQQGRTNTLFPVWWSCITTKAPANNGFIFGVPSGAPPEVKPSMVFGSMTGGNTSATVGSEAPKTAPGFSFGPPADAPKTSIFGATTLPVNPFGAPNSGTADAPKQAFGGFSFGQSKEAPKSSPATSSPFSFGAATSTPLVVDAGNATTTSTPFSFGLSAASAPASTPTFSFGTAATDTAAKPPTPGGVFTFGTPTVMASSARPVTPPRNDMQEFRMEESPTRDMQVNGEIKPVEPRPTLGSGFSFNNPSSAGSMFGQNTAAAAPAPFSFGRENKPFGGSDFGRPQGTSNPFEFGQNTASNPPNDPPRPSTTGSFSFQSSGPSMDTGFTFGGGATNANTFAPQPQASGSVPNSPSTFNQPFSFGAPAPQTSGSFSFGSSQPVSPVGVASSLPQPTTPGGFGGGSFSAQPSSPFSAGGVAPTPTGGGSLFTIGAAPPPAPSANGPRLLKKLPRRKN